MKNWFKRPPDKIIGEDHDPYLLRWYLIPRNRFFNVYLHKFMRSDDDRALHDHPWPSIGMIIKGEYDEIVPRYPHIWKSEMVKDRSTITIRRRRFRPVFRRAGHIHRIQLIKWAYKCVYTNDGGSESIRIGDLVTLADSPVWTIFITGPHVREWGFWCPQGFRHWKEFVSIRPGGNATGKGCD